MPNRFIFIWMMFCGIAGASGQVGGEFSFGFLNLHHSARTTALGGGAISTKDQDVSLALMNPALLNAGMISDISFHHNFHFADVQHGLVNAGFRWPGHDIFMHAGVQYVQYGEFIRSDEFGNIQGDFKAQQVAVFIGASKPLDERVQLGVNLKLANSRLESYSSLAWAMDLGLTYENPESQILLAIVAKSIGTQIAGYSELKESLPFELQLGISKRFEHLPFRFSVTVHHLNQWNLLYDDPSLRDPVSVFGVRETLPSGFGKEIDNFFRHFIFSGEFLIGRAENLKLRFGYNHQRKKELSVSSFRSLGGFSLGFGMKIKKFRFDYGIGYYHLAGAVNHIGLGINLHEFNSGI